jgi:hypothetical protein
MNNPISETQDRNHNQTEQPGPKMQWVTPKLYDLSLSETEAHDFTSIIEFSSLGRQYGPES